VRLCAAPSFRPENLLSSGRIGAGRRGRGIPHCSTNTRGTRCCSRRIECIRRGRRAFCDQPRTGGFRVPRVFVSIGRLEVANVAYIGRWGIALEVWLDGTVLLVELGHVGNEVLDHVSVRQWVDARFFGCVGGDTAEAGQGVDAVNVHGATAADTLSAAPSEGQSRVNLVLDPNQGIQHHRAGLVKVERVGLHAGLRRGLIWVPSVDLERLDLRILLDRRGLRDGGCLACGLDGGVRASEDRRYCLVSVRLSLSGCGTNCEPLRLRASRDVLLSAAIAVGGVASAMQAERFKSCEVVMPTTLRPRESGSLRPITSAVACVANEQTLISKTT
jgi:hypothetical protein